MQPMQDNINWDSNHFGLAPLDSSAKVLNAVSTLTDRSRLYRILTGNDSEIKGKENLEDLNQLVNKINDYLKNDLFIKVYVVDQNGEVELNFFGTAVKAPKDEMGLAKIELQMTRNMPGVFLGKIQLREANNQPNSNSPLINEPTQKSSIPPQQVNPTPMQEGINWDSYHFCIIQWDTYADTNSFTTIINDKIRLRKMLMGNDTEIKVANGKIEEARQLVDKIDKHLAKDLLIKLYISKSDNNIELNFSGTEKKAPKDEYGLSEVRNYGLTYPEKEDLGKILVSPPAHNIEIWDSKHLFPLPLGEQNGITWQIAKDFYSNFSRLYKVLTGNDYQYKTVNDSPENLKQLVKKINDHIKKEFVVILQMTTQMFSNDCYIQFIATEEKVAENPDQKNLFVERLNFKSILGQPFGSVIGNATLLQKHNLKLWDAYHMLYLAEDPQAQKMLKDVGFDNNPQILYYVLNGLSFSVEGKKSPFKIKNEQIDSLKKMIDKLDNHIKNGYFVLIKIRSKDQNTFSFEFCGLPNKAANDVFSLYRIVEPIGNSARFGNLIKESFGEADISI